jgi:OFA family oxalate/formate antiporter-like MFS transporter
MAKPAHITYNRGLVLGNLVALLLFLGLIYAWSIFRAPFGAMFKGWTVTQLSWPFTISIASYCVCGFVASRLIKRFHPRQILWISALLVFIGFMALGAFIDKDDPNTSLTVLYVFYGVFVGGGVGVSYNTSLGVVARNFPDRAGLATGTTLLGFGLGGMILGAAVNAIEKNYGLNTTFFVLGVALPVIVLIVSLMIKIPGPAPAPAAASNASAPAPQRQFSLNEAMVSPSFWVFWVWLVLITLGAMVVINFAAPIATSYLGPTMAVVGLIVTVANGLGRPLGGASLDGKGRAFTMYTICIGMIAGGALLLLGHNDVPENANGALIIGGLILTGLAYGMLAALSPVALRFYGPKDYQSIVGVVLCQMIVAAIIGPILASFLVQTSGNYYSSFIVIVVAAVIGVGVNFLLGITAHKEGLGGE